MFEWFFLPFLFESQSLEEALKKLTACRTAVEAFRPHIDELEQYRQAEQEAIILENKYTKYSMETLRVGWEQLLTSINRNINEVENQVAALSLMPIVSFDLVTLFWLSPLSLDVICM